MSIPVIEVHRCSVIARRPRYEDLKELVYALTQLVPVGCVTTYGSIARVLGISPRLVGKILSENEHPVEVPCHRVVSVKGLGGYTLRGKRALDLKKRLIQFESGDSPRSFDLYTYLVIGIA